MAMKAMSWLGVRRRTLAGAAVVTVAALGIATMAVAYEGNPTTELDLNDGSVWITKTDQQFVGHFNAQSQVLDGRLAAGTADYDVLQDGDHALVVDSGDMTIGEIDAAAVSLADRVQVPPGAVVDYAANTVAILDPAKGAVYVVPLGGVPSFAIAEAKPTVDKLGENVAVTVARDGTVYAASPSRAALYTIRVSPEGVADKDGISQEKLEGVDETSRLSITSVADRAVVLDETAGALFLPGAEPLTLSEPEGARLALDAADGDAVVVATRTELLSVPLDGSDPVATPAGATAGTPAAPVWLNGCAYGAWMESGRFVRDCIGEQHDRAMAIPEYRAGGELRFRVNRDVVMLNDVLTGGAWLASDVLQKVDNWDDLTPPESEDGVENPDPTTVQVPDPSPPDRGPENTPPQANSDRFGVRAGSSTILPVLSGFGPDGEGADSDADGDVLVVSLPDGPPAGVDIQPVNDGSALQITVPEDVTSVPTFRYEVNDGRTGGTAEATVAVDVKPESENAPPAQLRQIAVPVESGSSVTYNVLPDWIDPDGDDIYLENVSPAEGDEAQFTADGRITYRAVSGNQGPIEVPVTVSDGRSSMSGVLALDVRAPDTSPPIVTADHLIVREGQQGTVDPLANDLSASDDPLELTQVSEVKGATIVADFTDDTFTFQSGTAGTYYVDYLASTSGTRPVPGLVRVDVVKPAETPAPPVAVRDVALLPPGGDALVNVLANDSDPSGGVLVVQGVEVDPASGVSVSVLGHETLRVTDQGLAGDTGQIKVRYTISNGVAPSVDGEVVVIPMPASGKLRAPVVNDDTAIVRVGDVVTIPVLENDYDPNDDEFHLDPTLVAVPDAAAGEVFVSQDDVRFRASDQPGTVYVTYAAVDSTGQRDAAQVAIQVLPRDDENNNAPNPRDVEARTLEGTETTITIPLDRIDPDGDSVELVGPASGPKLGSILKTTANTIVYEAFKGKSGVDTFAYRVRDGFGAEATASIRVGIAPKATQNQPPFAVRDSLAMRPDREVAAPVLDNDSDPDGEKVGLVQGDDSVILAEDAGIEAEALGNRLIVRSPDQELETSLQYTIEDERGAQARGVLQITVDDEVPLQPPVARDDFVLIEDVTEDETADVVLLENDEDPDGTAEALELELEPDEGARLVGDGTVRVDIAEKRRLIGYTVTDQDGQTAKAFIHVPGEEDLRPTLISTEPAVVKSGERIDLPLADYVKTASGRPVRITEAEKVTSGHGDGSSLVIDQSTLTYTSEYRYFGNDAVTFEVTDGSGPDDPNGRVSTLSIPILVTSPDNEAPEMSGASVRVGAGDSEPATVDLAGLASDIDEDPLRFEVVEEPAGLQAQVVDGGTLSVTADADQKGTVADVTVMVDDGQDNPRQPEPVTARIQVTVTASTREMPVATDDTYAEWNQGETLTAEVLRNDVNPFAAEGEPLTVTGAVLETGAPGDARVEFTDSSVKVTPAGDFHGRLVVAYTVQDATGDPERTAEARVYVTVQGRPDMPGKPTVSSVQSRQVTLSWEPPPDNGAPITEYQVTAVKGGEYETTCPETTCTLTGLTNNVTYQFTVTAVNRVGPSDPSPASQDARPDVRPERPVAPQLPQFRDSGLLVSWTAPRTEGSPIEKYELEITPAPPSGVNTKTVPAGTTQVWWDGLVNGTAYTVRVRAHNKAPDPSEWSPQSGTNIPAKPPVAPAAPTAKRQGSIGPAVGGVEVSWPAVEGPDAGGDAVDQYEVKTFRGGQPYGDVHTTSGTRFVASLPAANSDYTFTVRARNKAGFGGWSAASAPLRQFTSPTQPGTPSVQPGDRQVRASWSAATAEGSTDIRYQYSVNGGGWQDAGANTSATIGGLANGTTYRVAVRAYAVANGTQSEPGPASAQSAAVVPFGPPRAPKATATRSANGQQVTCAWDARASENGRPITVQARFFDGNGWQNVAKSGSRVCANGYSQSGQVEVRVTASEGGTASALSPKVTTIDRPATATASYVPTSVANPNGVVAGCTNTCRYLQLNYQNFPSGTYSVACQERDPTWHTFSTWNGRLGGSGSARLTCAYGYANQVRLVVTGNGVNIDAYID
ncbi:Ig-like domain-containing protein [Microbacterium sp. NPDC096154]|uniref:Ig-like domain-containing protein n=1 Tax=Microbacterium sp. NPDC096154 TaxID=3155549 RepID=UPI00331AE34D